VIVEIIVHLYLSINISSAGVQGTLIKKTTRKSCFKSHVHVMYVVFVLLFCDFYVIHNSANHCFVTFHIRVAIEIGMYMFFSVFIPLVLNFTLTPTFCRSIEDKNYFGQC
jgi:hypothetical protein